MNLGTNLEVYRDPHPDADRIYGASWASRQVLRPGETIAALFRRDVALQVAELF